MLPKPTEAPAVHKYTARLDDQAAAGRLSDNAIQGTPSLVFRKNGPFSDLQLHCNETSPHPGDFSKAPGLSHCPIRISIDSQKGQTMAADGSAKPVSIDSYERHLIADTVVDPSAAAPRGRFEAVARAVRDVLSQRWIDTETTY